VLKQVWLMGWNAEHSTMEGGYERGGIARC
jgi:hypothetical protein